MTELDAQIVEDNDVVDEQPMDEEPSLVLGDEDPRDAELHEKILSEETAWRGKILDVRSLAAPAATSSAIPAPPPLWL